MSLINSFMNGLWVIWMAHRCLKSAKLLVLRQLVFFLGQSYLIYCLRSKKTLLVQSSVGEYNTLFFESANTRKSRSLTVVIKKIEISHSSDKKKSSWRYFAMEITMTVLIQKLLYFKEKVLLIGALAVDFQLDIIWIFLLICLINSDF